MSQVTEQKNTVFAYCNQFKPKIQVPSDVIKLCIAYYALPDEWDPSNKSKEIRIYHHANYLNILARYPPQKWHKQRLGTSVGLKVCKSGIHQWILRIVESQNDHSNYSVVIGVTKNKYIDECLNTKSSYKHPGGTNARHRLPVPFMRFNGIDRGYGIVANRACKMVKFNANEHKLWRYGKPFKNPNDVMRVILDLNQFTLSFIINDTNYGEAFDVDKDAQYRLAVCLLPGITVELCDMEESRVPCNEISSSLCKYDMTQSICQRITWKHITLFLTLLAIFFGVVLAKFELVSTSWMDK